VPQAQDLRQHLSPADRRPTASWCCEAWSRSGRALRGVSRIQRGRPAPAHRHFGSATSRTRNNDATPGIGASEDQPQKEPPNDRLTTEGSRNERTLIGYVPVVSAVPKAEPPAVVPGARCLRCLTWAGQFAVCQPSEFTGTGAGLSRAPHPAAADPQRRLHSGSDNPRVTSGDSSSQDVAAEDDVVTWPADSDLDSCRCTG